MIEKDEVPEHDVVVTNPPFSGDHVSKILRFCSRRGAKPWFLLLPNFVYLKVLVSRPIDWKGLYYKESSRDDDCWFCRIAPVQFTQERIVSHRSVPFSFSIPLPLPLLFPPRFDGKRSTNIPGLLRAVLDERV